MTNAESKYWPTEFETTKLVWVVNVNDFQKTKNAINDFEEFNHVFVPIAILERYVLPDFPLPEQPRRIRLTTKQRVQAAIRKRQHFFIFPRIS